MLGYINDHVSDILIRIQNAQRSKLQYTSFYRKKTSIHDSANISIDLLDTLYREGYITSYEVKKDHLPRGKDDQFVDKIQIHLKYHSSAPHPHLPVIRQIKRISKPGRRVYISNRDIRYLSSQNTFELYIISTPQGLYSLHTARKLGLGGELLCKII
uniref:Ribosomal protein S8 n=1 Tax=Moramonas marocensis TaxID=1805496 RepID=A0A140F2G7_9EUKA|nr:ribosomal protein S8 [Moramonas marocensis]